MTIKSLSLLALAAAALIAAACQSDEVLSSASQPRQGAIAFEPFVDKATRGVAETKNSNIKRFLVWGDFTSDLATSSYAKVFDGQRVTLNGQQWTYSPLRYWMAGNGGNAYVFNALADAATTDGIAGARYEQGAIDAGKFLTHHHGKITFDNQTADAASDLVWASYKVEDAKANEATVAFNFKHILSRVRLQFKNCFQSQLTQVKISDVKINSAARAELNLAAQPFTSAVSAWPWTAHAGAFDKAFTFDGSNDSQPFTSAEAEGATTEAFCLIPSQELISVSFTTYLYNSGNVVGFWKHNYMLQLDEENLNAMFKPGYSYTLVANIDETNIGENSIIPITFIIEELKDWIDEGEMGYNYLITFASDEGDPKTKFDVKEITVGGPTLDLTTYIVDPVNNNVPDFATIAAGGLTKRWESDNTEIATVDESTGAVTAVAEGTAHIRMELRTAADEMIGIASCIVNVKPEEVSISGETTVTYGEPNETLTVPTAPTGATATWTSSKTNVATIDPTTGEVTAMSQGNTTIDVEYRNSANNVVAKGTCTLTVKSAQVSIASSKAVDIYDGVLRLGIGETSTLSASDPTNTPEAIEIWWKSYVTASTGELSFDESTKTVTGEKVGTVYINVRYETVNGIIASGKIQIDVTD